MRNSNIDFLRFILILFVVQHHLGPYNGAAALYSFFNVHFVVWMFMLVSLYLLQIRGATFGKVKWSRLIVPYLSWSFIYLCLRSLKGMLQGQSYENLFDGWTLQVFLTGGAAVHLYFIPLLIFYQLMVCALSSLFLTKPDKNIQLINCGALIIAFMISSTLELKSPIIGSEYGLFMDALFVFICAQALVSLNANVGLGSSLWFKLVLFFWGMFLFWWQTNLNNQVLVKVIFVTGIFHIILQMPVSNKIKRLNWLFTASFGIFLIHHAIIELAEVLFARLGVQLIPYNLTERILGTFVVVVISYGLIHLIRRSKFFSLLLIGEKT